MAEQGLGNPSTIRSWEVSRVKKLVNSTLPRYPTTIHPFYTKAGELAEDEDDILNRWSEYFCGMFCNMPKVAPELPFPLAFPGLVPERAKAPELTEVRSAIYQQKNWKAPGRDNINSKIWKVEKLSSELLHQVIVDVWHTDTIPQDWLEAMIVLRYKRKGGPVQCDIYRGVSVL